ncbi:hypothetical protein DNTS_020675 [Danionella cerebrum]|uniref:Vacuolar protein-sorting-associated protein 36 n=1 Tax=Danionella cerebrum TaxID=2873325 RepID=A0A553PZR9_9TELE|nr:hypothetical protein DNTS_020675 [Danionella translucida]
MKAKLDVGLVLLSTHRLLWRDQKNHECCMCIPLSQIIFFEEQAGGIGKSAKIVIHLHPASENKDPGPYQLSKYSYIKLSFKEHGQIEFYRRLTEEMTKKRWENTPVSQPMPTGTASKTGRTRAVGIVGIERKLEEKRKETDKNISETIRFKSYLLSMGIANPERGGMMALTEVYCLVNRARGMELLSPEDLVNACKMFESLKLPLRLRVFDSGVMVVQLQSHSEEEMIASALDNVSDKGSLTAEEFAKLLGLSVLLAKERLLLAEKMGHLCRDDSVEDHALPPNFLTAGGRGNSGNALSSSERGSHPAMAGIHLWPSMHIALSNASVFVDYSTDNITDHRLTVTLIDVDRNITVFSRLLPLNQSEGSLEFNCSCFLYAGNFRFRLEQRHILGFSNRSAIWWWSPVLHVHWPTFHLAVDRGSNNRSSSDFRIGIFTNDHFHPCSDSKASTLHLDVTYLEHVQIGRNTFEKVQNKIRHNIKVVRSQHVEMPCGSPLTERGFIQISLKSPHIQQDIKSSGPLYLSSIFSYKLLVDNIYKSGCEGVVSVRRISPPCTVANGKVLLYKESSKDMASSSQLAFNFLTHAENETEFNCSIFDPGKHKYCFHFTLIYSQAPSLAHACVIVQRHTKTWGPWQPWSECSVTCGEGVRERVRECLLPSSGGIQCTGMVREQSHCSLEDCTVTEELPTPPLTPPSAASPVVAGNLVVVAGISLCLTVILATIFITLWRKLCHAPKCSSMRRSSLHSPSGRKNSDEASICGHSVQRPSFSESLHAGSLQKGLTLPSKPGPSDRGVLARPQSMTLPLSRPQEAERTSPSGQKILPPVFSYRLAQQQLKEMKMKGLKEATQVYHVSQSPVDDAMLEATASTPIGQSPVPKELDNSEESTISQFRMRSTLAEPIWPPKNNGFTPRRKVDLLQSPTKSAFSATSRCLERTADWVEMVERSRLPYSNNTNFRRTASFHENNQQPFSPSRPYRERSMTQVTPRQVPEGSCRSRTWEHAVPELEVWSSSSPKLMDGSTDHRRRPWVDSPSSQSKSKDSVPVTPTKEPLVNRQHGSLSPSSMLDRAERAEQNWSRRGPSPIQRNILARKLREANSSSCHRKRSSTFSSSEQRRGRCRSLPLSADFSNSPYSLTESEQRMMDISSYLGEDDGVEVLTVQKLTRTKP